MFSLAIVALASLASSAHALAIPRSDIPSGYATGYLESYHQYHARYMALDCQSKHGTPFFTDCCHPMLATENLKDNRKPYCTPSPDASSSAAIAEPTSTVVPSGDPECDDDQSSSSTSNSPSPSAAAPPPVNVGGDPTDSSSSPPAPSPIPAVQPKPSPSSSPAPAPAPSPAPAPAPSPSSSGGLSGIIGQIFQGGIATFFFQNGVAGNCGIVHDDGAFIVALETSTYAGGAHCGKKIRIMDVDTGHTEDAIVADSCPSCNNPQSIDLSQGLFNQFAPASVGIFNVKWAFLE